MSREWWETRLFRFDPVAPVVVLHMVALVVLGGVRRPVAVLAAAGVMLVWRSGMAVLAAGVTRIPLDLTWVAWHVPL